jgi:hypothetical protein
MAEKTKENLTDTQKNRNFVNTPMDDDLKEKLDIMVDEHGGTNQAAFVRMLIWQEWERRELAKRVASKLRAKGLLPK